MDRGDFVRAISSEDYGIEVLEASMVKPVVLDIWDPAWPPCIVLAPKFDELAAQYGDRIDFMKMNRSENRDIVKTLRLRGVPTIIFMCGGEEFSARLVGDTRATVENIKEVLDDFLNKK